MLQVMPCALLLEFSPNYCQYTTAFTSQKSFLVLSHLSDSQKFPNNLYSKPGLLTISDYAVFACSVAQS